MKKNLIIGVTGASGAIYAKLLFENLYLIENQLDKVAIVFSDNAKQIYSFETGSEFFPHHSYKLYENNDFYAPFASGSCSYDTMIICPCSMGSLGRIANGISNDLITRAADVILKERRKLILVTRETPLNLIHINNMKAVTEAGGIICPANPSFYLKPQNIEQLVFTVISRVLVLAGFNINNKKWGE